MKPATEADVSGCTHGCMIAVMMMLMGGLGAYVFFQAWKVTAMIAFGFAILGVNCIRLIQKDTPWSLRWRLYVWVIIYLLLTIGAGIGVYALVRKDFSSSFSSEP